MAPSLNGRAMNVNEARPKPSGGGGGGARRGAAVAEAADAGNLTYGLNRRRRAIQTRRLCSHNWRTYAGRGSQLSKASEGAATREKQQEKMSSGWQRRHPDTLDTLEISPADEYPYEDEVEEETETA